MYNFIQSKIVIVLVIVGSMAVAATAVPVLVVLAAILAYGFFGLLIITAISHFGYKSSYLHSYLIDKTIQIGVVSLAMVPALYFAMDKLNPYDGMTVAQIRAKNAIVARNLCTAYYQGNAWDHYVRLREWSWCSAFPEYDTTARAKIAAVSLDEESTGSTKVKIDGLWK